MQSNGPSSNGNASSTAQATLAGGCFWCLEAAYQKVDGVRQVTSGYTGGHVENPGYRAVCSGETGHAEAVQLAYDPATISYRDLLEIFFTIHDPTQLNRQGADVGTQYRSAIFHHDENQREEAETLIERLESDGVYSGIVTEVEPLDTFYEAEAEHHDYYQRHPEAAYCQAVINPKLAKLRKKHEAQLQA